LLVGCWEALLSVIIARRGGLSWGNRFQNWRKLQLQKLALWLVTTGTHSGPAYPIAFVKKAAGQARLTVIEGVPLGEEARFLLRLMPGMGDRKGLEQFSYCGRALPEGDSRVAEKSLSAHLKNMTTPHRTDPELLSRARSYARSLAEATLGDYNDPRISCSPSAVFAHGRSKGGCREAVRRRRKELVPDSDEVQFGGFLGDKEVLISRYNSGSLPLLKAATLACAMTERPEHRVCTIPERGWKRRIVSAPPEEASLAGGALNSKLLAALKKEPRCRRFLEGNRRLAVEEAARGHTSGFRVVSTDLTAATDALPHDLVKAVVDGLVEGWKGLPDEVAECLYALTGPQVLHYPDGRVVDSVRGVLMGLGPSWPLMSIIHLFWVDYSASGLSKEAVRAGHFNTAIGGDDLVGFWPPELLKAYRSTVTRCGGSFSKGKDFESSSSGNFTEMSFDVSARSPGVPGKVRWMGGIPTKGLTDLSLDLEGEAFESFGSDAGRATKARRVISTLRPACWRRCRQAGVVPCMPRALGGAGLPPRRGSVARVSGPLWLRLAVGRLLYGAGNDRVPLTPPSWVESRDRVAVLSRAAAEQTLEQEEAFGMVRFTTDPTKAPGKMLVSDWLQNETSLFTASRLFDDKPLAPSRSGLADPRAHGRLVRKWARGKTRGGVPNSLAIQDNRKTRFALLARLARNRATWYVAPSFDEAAYFGGEVPV
jgi:hypothetical protein